MKPPRHILLVYKKSLYQIYFLDKSGGSDSDAARIGEADLARLRAAHDAHLASLQAVQTEIRRRGWACRQVYRARRVDYTPYDLIISVGGDGTLIEAARGVTTQLVLGVNSDPQRSAGHFCECDAAGLPSVLDRLLAGQQPIRRLNRMRLSIDGRDIDFPAMNDVLIAHQSPAAMSRYLLRVGGHSERQRGSGLWISTAAGSTGAVRSAGGRIMPLGSARLQYLAREPFHENGDRYTLRHGIVAPGEGIAVTSLMREGAFWVDGAHWSRALPHGAVLTARNHPHPLRIAMTDRNGDR